MREIPIQDLQLNPMTKIGREWMLITAGNADAGFNTMTASWGHLGSIWGANNGSPTAVIFVRPQRYTKEFVDREEIFTLTFFGEEFRKDLAYLGSHSGRDEDKIAKTKLTPLFLDETTGFEEAELTLVCRKLYRSPILEEGFIDKSVIEENYPKRDYHDMYIAEIMKAYVKE